MSASFYSLFYRRTIRPDRLSEEIRPSTVFVSAFNSSERVRRVFDGVQADRKIWLVHPEYQYLPFDLPAGETAVFPALVDEVSQVTELLDAIGDPTTMSLCIDITGFMRHVLIFLFAKLAHLGVRDVQVLYSEPDTYTNQEDTVFSTKTSGTVRPVRGMRAVNNENASVVLLLGVGFDHKLISEVMNHKENVEVFPILGFPPLSPDMYQQSALRASASGGQALEDAWLTNRRFAPANDPFATAAVISEIIGQLDRGGNPPNVYLSPLSTKAQALGFAIYWILEGRNRGGVSILLPECVTYSRETSHGIRRLQSFDVELM